MKEERQKKKRGFNTCLVEPALTEFSWARWKIFGLPSVHYDLKLNISSFGLLKDRQSVRSSQ